jgi:hypothetical protein
MKLEAARKIHAAGLASAAALEALLGELDGQLDDEERDLLKKRIAKATGEVYVAIMWPLEHEFPELAESPDE